MVMLNPKDIKFHFPQIFGYTSTMLLSDNFVRFFLSDNSQLTDHFLHKPTHLYCPIFPGKMKFPCPVYALAGFQPTHSHSHSSHGNEQQRRENRQLDTGTHTNVLYRLCTHMLTHKHHPNHQQGFVFHCVQVHVKFQNGSAEWGKVVTDNESMSLCGLIINVQLLCLCVSLFLPMLAAWLCGQQCQSVTIFHDPQRINHPDSGDPLIFPLVPTAGWHSWF